MDSRNLRLALAAIAVHLLLLGCGGDYIDISRLSKHDRKIFKEAAHSEGVSTTTNPMPWDWVVVYGGTGKKSGLTKHNQFGFCEIHISRNLKACDPGGRDRRVFVVARHEIKHCKRNGGGHSKNSGNLMNQNIPCWAISK